MSSHIPTEQQPCVNTDREIWRERPGDYYADSIHVTQEGFIGINCGGYVYVKPLREWHKLAGGKEAMQPVPDPPSSKERDYLAEFEAANEQARVLLLDAGRYINYLRIVVRNMLPHFPADDPKHVGYSEAAAGVEPPESDCPCGAFPLDGQMLHAPSCTRAAPETKPEPSIADVFKPLPPDESALIDPFLPDSSEKTSAERTPKDYAIEHAEYLAQAAESYIGKVDQYMELLGDDEPDDDQWQSRSAAMGDHRDALTTAVYEFRKRAERARTTPDVDGDCIACSVGNPGVYIKDGRMVCPHRPEVPRNENP